MGREASLIVTPKEWIASFGEIAKFCGGSSGTSTGCASFASSARRCARPGILILSSTLVIWGLVFIIGLQCGIEGAYLSSVGSPAYAGVFSRLVRPARAGARTRSAT